MSLTAKGHYVCGHCGSTALPEGVERDGVRVLGAGDGSRRCPSCGALLSRAMVDERQVAYCEACRGMLLPRRSFAEVIRRRRAWAETAPVIPVPPDRAEMNRQLCCPQCGAGMIVDRYYGPGNIIMDSCTTCDLVWLDYGELKQVIDAPGIDRGTRDLR
jgi:Zn-finger nucleic acid-binding protein